MEVPGNRGEQGHTGAILHLLVDHPSVVLQGCEVRWVSGGHVLAFLSHQDVFRQAISDAMARLPTRDDVMAAAVAECHQHHSLRDKAEL